MTNLSYVLETIIKFWKKERTVGSKVSPFLEDNKLAIFQEIMSVLCGTLSSTPPQPDI